MSSSPRIVIVGAGISGLTTALYLQEQQPSAGIAVLEISQHIGGLLKTSQKEGYLVEQGPACINSDDQHTLKLCQQLGLSDKLCESVTSANAKLIVHDGKLIRYSSNPKDIRRSSPLAISSILRSRLERFLPRKRSQEDESIWHFARRRFGSAFADFFADAAATEFFAGDPKLLSLRSCFPDLASAERQFGSVYRGLTKIKQSQSCHGSIESELFPTKNPLPRTFTNGMQVLAETIAGKLKQSPCLGMGVQRLEENRSDHGPRWIAHCEPGKSWPADVVILTSPAPRQAAILAEQDADLSDALLTISHAPLIVLNLAYTTKHLRKSVDWSTLIAPQKYKRNILSVEFSSLLFSDRAPPNHILLRILCGGWHRQEMLHWDDGTLLLLVRAELGKLLGAIKPPAFMNISHSATAIPQMMVGHSDRLANIRRRNLQHPGLFLGGQAFWGTSINDCVVGAESLAKQVSAYLSSHLT